MFKHLKCLRNNNYEDFYSNRSNVDSQDICLYEHSIENDNSNEKFDNDILKYFKQYFQSLIQIKKPLLMLCITNCFCWMSLVCYSLYFTDFVAKEIFGT